MIRGCENVFSPVFKKVVLNLVMIGLTSKYALKLIQVTNNVRAHIQRLTFTAYDQLLYKQNEFCLRRLQYEGEDTEGGIVLVSNCIHILDSRI